MSDGATPASSSGSKEKEFVLNADGSILIDHKGKPVTVERFLCTKPLRAEVSTRKGPGGMKLSYMGGDMVTKSLNEAFGYDGWCLEVKDKTREEAIKDEKGRHHVAYVATVRVTHRRSGVFREDCGAGDAIDRSLASASGNALKGAVTDAMKRAARHFGEKLGNSLYHDGFNANNAPSTLKDSLDNLDIDRAKSRFGFDKDKNMAGQNAGVTQTKASNQIASGNSAPAAMVKQETTKAPSNCVPNSTQSSYSKRTPRTQYVGNVVMEHSNMLNQSKANPAEPSHVTPGHHGAGNNAARNVNVASSNQNAVKSTNTPYVTPGNRAITSNNKSSTFDPSIFAAVPADMLGNNGKENSNPQRHPPKAGLALPPRPGTSRGADISPTSAYIANFPESNGAPSMFGTNGSMSQALTMGQGQSTTIAQSLKRKRESMDGTGTSSVAKSASNGARNPYSC
mmetsp:Transcript_8407/g.15299  ORF Transcript_8407/g.15299 Transcript_8407/m.15299 type:complete len:453 (-) Transcript_8407:8-1366(-)